MRRSAVCLLLLAVLALSVQAKRKKNKNPEPPQWKGPDRSAGNGPVYKILTIGKSLELDCSARGRPKPRISWYKNGAELAPSDAIKIRRYTLTIKKVQAADSGNYTCRVKNKEGELDRLYIISIKRGVWPLKLEGPENITALEGENVSFRCRVLNDPDAHIKWMVSRKTSDGGIDSSPNATAQFIEDLADPGVLVLQGITTAHSGKYTCMTGNEWGLESKDAYLTVNPAGVPPTASVHGGYPEVPETAAVPTLPPFMPGGNEPSFGFDNQDYDLDNNNRGRGRKDRKRNRDRNGNGRNRKKNRRPNNEEEEVEVATTPRELDDWDKDGSYNPEHTGNSHETYDPYPGQPYPHPEDPVLVGKGNQTGMLDKPAEGEGTIGLFTIYTIVGSVAGVILLLGLIAISVAVCCRRDPNNVYKSTSV